jgi:hypothetical protein
MHITAPICDWLQHVRQGEKSHVAQNSGHIRDCCVLSLTDRHAPGLEQKRSSRKDLQHISHSGDGMGSGLGGAGIAHLSLTQA